MDLLGAHVSVSGGPHTAFERGADIGCNSLQIFVKSPNRWSGAKLGEKQVVAFEEERSRRPQPVIAHAAYLINLCGSDPLLVEKSRAGLVDELRRCERLGVDALVVHPGAHLGQGEEAGLEGIARSVDAVLREVPGGKTRLLLENTAGQGTVLGSSFAQLAQILSTVQEVGRVGVCLDTCHAFAAGYRLDDEAGYSELLAVIAESCGLERVEALHINDSKHPWGSRKDRHANVGEGEIGAQALARVVTDSRWQGRPLILETPLGDDDKGHQRDLERLRALIG